MTNYAWRVGGEAAEAFLKMQDWKPDFGVQEQLASLAWGDAGGLARKEDSCLRGSSVQRQRP